MAEFTLYRGLLSVRAVIDGEYRILFFPPDAGPNADPFAVIEWDENELGIYFYGYGGAPVQVDTEGRALVTVPGTEPSP